MIVPHDEMDPEEQYYLEMEYQKVIQQRFEEDKLKGPAKVIVFEDKEVKAIIIENAD